MGDSRSLGYFHFCYFYMLRTNGWMPAGSWQLFYSYISMYWNEWEINQSIIWNFLYSCIREYTFLSIFLCVQVCCAGEATNVGQVTVIFFEAPSLYTLFSKERLKLKVKETTIEESAHVKISQRKNPMLLDFSKMLSPILKISINFLKVVAPFHACAKLCRTLI